MALKDLEGKRTGRPPGAKTTSRVKRDIAWAYRNLDNPDAKPPSTGARMWLEHARQEPGHFLDCVLTADAEPEPAANPSYKLPRRIRRLVMGARHLLLRLTRDDIKWISNLPKDTQIVGCDRDGEGRIVLVVYSEGFLPVLDGQPIPEFPAEFTDE
jgi:hypothetical protein